MEINFQYTKEEYVDSRRKYLFMSKAITKLSIAVLLVFLVLEIILLIKKIYIVAACFGVIYIIYIIMLYFLYLLQPGMVFDKTNKFHNEYFLDFEDDIIKFKTQDIHSEFKWDIYNQLWENEKYFYLIQAKDMYSLIPKRIFTNKEQENKFINQYLKHNSKDTYKIFK